ncbi:sugar ABC transporter permease [Salinisphaera sp.]|uniref:carbohydrate ABC transporter permease n=1 Tax=Salinisphaera sp. TaxID=1914330 RepID=UPI002D796EF1|nr:sugar ABC transporter permease [Salinisphaera sp.]HET7313557.1 sugar ABC transporter permease [Salinisphaera sp.]
MTSTATTGRRLGIRRGAFAPYLFVAPAFIFFAIWVIYPIIQSFIVSFYDWSGFGAGTFIGLDNYRELFDSHQFWVSLKNNVLWLVLFMLAPPLGLLIALFLNQQILGIRLAKSLFFFPFVLSQVVIGLVFSWFYQPVGGLINAILGAFGIPPVAVLSNPVLVNFGIIAAGLWPQIAYCMIIYLTGLNSVNPEQIEAARLEGAKGVRLLWHVILPQLRAATFIAVVITVIGALRSFDLVAIMTQGGPFNSSSVLAWYMYQESITNYRLGYGAAIAVILFLIMSVFIAYFLWRIVRDRQR